MRLDTYLLSGRSWSRCHRRCKPRVTQKRRVHPPIPPVSLLLLRPHVRKPGVDRTLVLAKRAKRSQRQGGLVQIARGCRSYCGDVVGRGWAGLFPFRERGRRGDRARRKDSRGVLHADRRRICLAGYKARGQRVPTASGEDTDCTWSQYVYMSRGNCCYVDAAARSSHSSAEAWKQFKTCGRVAPAQKVCTFSGSIPWAGYPLQIRHADLSLL